MPADARLARNEQAGVELKSSMVLIQIITKLANLLMIYGNFNLVGVPNSSFGITLPNVDRFS